MRPLALHSSALNDAEYTLFTENLGSLLDADCDDPEAQILTTREVRAWLRGRYPAIPSATIDRILALFPSKDSLNGGEFFAVLRLVLHVEAGKDVDRALAFIQVYPESAVTSVSASAAAAPQIQAPKEEVPAPPPSRTPQRHNPFLPPTPTLARSKTMPSSPSAPILPPRKAPAPAAAPLPPPRHPPLPPRSSSPPKPLTGHITSTLMKQSLQASKTGQWMKQGQARLEQERVLQVLRSTSSTPRPAPAAATSETEYLSSSSSDGSRSRPRSSIPPSTSSLEQVALAGSNSSSLNRAFDDAYRDTTLPPPLHPDRKSAPPSASSRVSVASESRLRASPERVPRQKPKPPPKPRSLNLAPTQSPFESPASQTRLTRSNSLRPSPPPPSTGRTGRTRPESVHALLGSLNSLRLPESPFGDPVRPRREDREALVSRQQDLESEESSSDSDVDVDGGWVGVGRFDPDADAGKDVDEGAVDGVGGRGRWRSESSVDHDHDHRRAPQERDSLKWPVDVEGEGWRPL